MSTDNRRIYTDVALLPLPESVLFPQTTLPLHVYQNHHRALVQRALTDNALIAVGTVDDQDGSGPKAAGDPGVFDIVGLGQIVEVESGDDGRFLIYLQGIARGYVLEEPDVQTPYRQVHVERLDDELDRRQRQIAEDRVQSIRGSLVTLDDRGVEGAAMLNYQAGQLRHPGSVADTVGASVFSKPHQRRWLLEQLDVLRRLTVVDQRLGTLIAEAYDINPADRSELN